VCANARRSRRVRYYRTRARARVHDRKSPRGRIALINATGPVPDLVAATGGANFPTRGRISRHIVQDRTRARCGTETPRRSRACVRIYIARGLINVRTTFLNARKSDVINRGLSAAPRIRTYTYLPTVSGEASVLSATPRLRSGSSGLPVELERCHAGPRDRSRPHAAEDGYERTG